MNGEILPHFDINNLSEAQKPKKLETRLGLWGQLIASFVRAGQAGWLSEAFPQINVRGMRTDVTILKSSCGIATPLQN